MTLTQLFHKWHAEQRASVIDTAYRILGMLQGEEATRMVEQQIEALEGDYEEWGPNDRIGDLIFHLEAEVLRRGIIITEPWDGTRGPKPPRVHRDLQKPMNKLLRREE